MKIPLYGKIIIGLILGIVFGIFAASNGWNQFTNEWFFTIWERSLLAC
ncbi:hypothetical protein CM15mP37_05240 [bacterium]|nr:MAG: hypothetical protein CM15mP37_05240 [bacterium]